MKLGELLVEVQDQELTEEQEEQIRKILNIKKNKKWKPKHNDEYFCVNSHGYIEHTTFISTNKVDEYRFLTNNCFKTKEEAEFRLEQIKVYYELKNFADENNDKIDWNSGKSKYYISMDKTNPHQWLHINQAIYSQNIGQIYFSTEKLARQALTKVGADRIQKYLFEVEEDD